MRRCLSALILSICVFAMSAASAVDVKRFDILKGIYYYQIAENAANLQTNNAYRFSAEIYATDLGDVLGASVLTPKAQRIDLLPDKDGDPFRFRDKFDDAFGLANNFPNGTYQLAVRTLHDHDRTLTFVVDGDAYPAAPILKNYNAAQALPYNEYNEISWQPFAGGGAGDFIQLEVEDLLGHNIWQTSDYGEPGALTGLDTRAIIPPGTLTAGVVYVGTIQFVKVLGSVTREYIGAPGTAGYFSRTEFTIRPVSIGVTPIVDRLQLWRTQRTSQLTNGGPTLQTQTWEFTSQADIINPGQVTAVQLKLPDGQTRTFDTNSSLSQFQFSEQMATNVEGFLALYKDGPYTFDFAPSGPHAVVNAPAGDFPPAPNLQGLTSFPNHPANQDLTLSWLPWTGAGPSDSVRVELFDGGNKVWDTPAFSSVKHLRGDATSVTIPSASLVAGHDYRVLVHFYRVNILDTRVIPGGIVFGGFDSRTRFDFSTQPADVPAFGIAEGQIFWQRGTNTYEPEPTGAFRFDASATSATATSLHSVQLTIPQNGSVQLTADTNNIFRFAAVEGLASSLAAHYPAETYTMHFDTANDGPRDVSIALPSTTLPPQPYVRNFQTLYGEPASADFPITWLKWENANTNTDSIHFTLENVLGQIVIDSNDSSHALSATSTNVIIFGSDSKELSPNQSYVGRLRFERNVRTEAVTYPGSRGTATLYSETVFYLSTLSPSRPFNGTVNFERETGEVQIFVTHPLLGRTYAIYQTTDLQNWALVKQQKLSEGVFLSFVPQGQGFYKVALLP